MAARQHGFVTRQQLLGLGVGPDAVKWRVRNARLIRIHQGVYAVGHLPVDPVDRAAAAVLACGPNAVLSHFSAAVLWGLRKRMSEPVEVTVPGKRTRPGIKVHRGPLHWRDVTTQLGIRATSPARTLLDIAPHLPDKALNRAVNDLRLKNYLRLGHLAELLERTSSHPGNPRLVPFLTAPGGPTRSEFEDAFAAFAEKYGLPRPLTNVPVAGFEADAFFPREGLIVELDGYDFHLGKAAFESDRDRDATTLAHGHPTVRITWERLNRQPAAEAARLNAILENLRSSQS